MHVGVPLPVYACWSTTSCLCGVPLPVYTCWSTTSCLRWSTTSCLHMLEYHFLSTHIGILLPVYACWSTTSCLRWSTISCLCWSTTSCLGWSTPEQIRCKWLVQWQQSNVMWQIFRLDWLDSPNIIFLHEKFMLFSKTNSPIETTVFFIITSRWILIGVLLK